MPKTIPLRDVNPEETHELERLAKKGTDFEARRARFILALPSLWGFVLIKLGRCKRSFEAQERAIAKTQALTLAGIMVKLKEEKLVPKSETNGRYALGNTTVGFYPCFSCA